MAWGYYFNMEVMALDIAKKHAEIMSENNYYDSEKMSAIIDDCAIYENMKNGFVVITQLSCYVESFINTILNRCIGYDGKLLRKNFEDKIDILFLTQQDMLKEIKISDGYKIFKDTTEVRNAMIHWKKSYIGEGTPIPEFKIAQTNAAEFFVKKNMNELIDKHIKLCDHIAKLLHLKINNEAKPFEADARDGLVNYVYDPQGVGIDPLRELQ